MTIRRSFKSSSRPQRRRQTGKRRRQTDKARRRAETVRGMRLERLEDRRLLAQLVSIQTNDGELLNDGDTLNVSPRDFSFQFNQDAQIDPNTLGAIQITGSGFDDQFDAASIKTDFNTAGQVFVQFTSEVLGLAGNGVNLQITKTDHGDASGPTLQVADKTISVDLNTNLANPTTAASLLEAMENDQQVRALVQAEVLSGDENALIALPDIDYSPLNLFGAKAAFVETNFNVSDALLVNFTALTPGSSQNGITLVFTRSDHGGADAPTVVMPDVNGSVINVDLNTNAGNETTVQQLLDAIRADVDASKIVDGRVLVGDPVTKIALADLGYSPLVLVGADDVDIESGAVYVQDGGREVIFRFNGSLADDIYRLDVLGSAQPLREVDGTAFNGGQDFTLGFEVDRGAQVVSVVPQPVRRDSSTGTLSQARDQIMVYFNDDDLNRDSAEDPAFYQLLFTRETLENTDDALFHPTAVEYDAASDTARLTFAAELDLLVDPATDQPVGGGSYRLRIGTDEVQAPRPLNADISVDAGSSFASATSVGLSIGVDQAGAGFVEGQTFTVTSDSGAEQVLEFDSGYLVQVPQTLMIELPETGAAAITDTERFIVTNGIVSKVFEFDRTGTVNGANVAISLLDTAGQPLSADELADTVIAAIDGVTPSLGLSPSNLGEGRIYLGSTAANSLDTALAPSLAVSGIAGGLEDGDAFVFSDGASDHTFLFDADNSETSTATTTVVAFTAGQTHEEIAANIAAAIAGAALGVTPVHLGDGLVHIGGRTNHTLDTSGANGNLTQSGTPGAQTADAAAVFFTPSSSFGASQVATAIATAINGANIGVAANVQTPPLDDTRIALVGAAAVDINDLAGLSNRQLDSLILSSDIAAQSFPIDLPGGNDDIGHREIRPETHLLGTLNPLVAEPLIPADSVDGITTQTYNFQDEYGFDPQGNVLLNAITDNQKQRAREIFELYSEYLGIDFVETSNLGFTVVTGDMRALDPEIGTGPGGVIGLAGGGLAIMDNAENWEDTYGAADVGTGKLSWFDTAMHEIGHLLGLGHTYDLSPQTVMGEERLLALSQTVEPVFPGDHDLVHGQYLFRPESKDIDLYEFEIAESGLLTVETFAERLVDPSLLDSAITIYQEVRNDLGEVTGHELVARNDDYFSEDAFVEIQLEPGRYFVGVTASGNTSYDPVIEDTGWGGTSQGDYELRLTFRKDADRSIVDTTGQSLDGDNNGLAGGVHNFWFRSEAPAQTIYVDKFNQPGPFDPAPTGALDNPLNNIAEALAAAQPGDIVRIVGNGGGDGLLQSSGDNLSYDVGFSRVGNSPLADGHTLEIPAGVTVMVDEGAVLKLRRARIGVGSSSPTIDRSGASLQVLGTPRLLDDQGAVIRDVSTAIVPGTVYFTSIHDSVIGDDANPDIRPPAPQGGDWGGVEFRNDIDQADASRFLYQDEGIFLNYINHAQFQYGGGEVIVAGISQVITPLHMTDARPTLSHNLIQQSAHAALSMNPDSSLESNFHAPQDQQIPFTSDYSRIGPQINDNQTVDNSINGLFIRVVTPAGQDLERLTVPGRWDDTDVTYVVAENLVIAGTPGGPLLEEETPPTVLVKLTSHAGGTLTPGIYNYRLTYVDAAGNESPPSDPTRDVELGLNGASAVSLENLPPAPSGFVGRRLYRSTDSASAPYELVDEISPDQTTFWDDGTTRGGALEVVANQLRSRFDGRLAIDPGATVKLQSSRLELQLGTQLIAEGMDGNEVIFTGISDDRYGAGGSFKTTPVILDPAPGQWGGIYLGPASRASLDHVVVAYAGGSSKVEGTFADFNAIELHQAEARIAHTLFENNAVGVGGPAPPERIGRGTNSPAVVFVRDAQPVLWNNVIQGNEAPAMSVDVNSLNRRPVRDGGRVTYFRNTAAADPSTPIDVFAGFSGNQGPLIRDNRLANNTLNGLLIRGGTLTTEGVWDDTDNVHIVLNEINVPDFHTYGGLRLTSNAAESLVVKLEGANAGFTAMGRPLDIDDRIGGHLQVVGHPRAPVVLTALTDDRVSAGLTPQGSPNWDTDNNGNIFDQVGPQALPTIGEIDNGLLIDNDTLASVVGHFEVTVGDGGSHNVDADGITGQGNTQLLQNIDAIFEYLNYVDVENGGEILNLSDTTITTAAYLEDDDLVVSQGEFDGENGVVSWRVESHFEDGFPILYNTVTFESESEFGDLQFVNYLDEDVQGISDDILYLTGTPGAPDFRAFTLDGPERIGFNQGGTYLPGADLVNMTYDGWAADQYAELQSAIEDSSATYSIPGDIDTGDLPLFTDPDLGAVYGPNDVTTAFAWTVDPAATTARIVTFLELVPEDPGKLEIPGGQWRSVRLEEFSGDTNVAPVVEAEASDLESGPDTNSTPNTAQRLGALAPHDKSGDDILRLGFTVSGTIANPSDVDVYSFEAQAGTEVWFDIDSTTHALDSVVELLNSDGTIAAQSDNSLDEGNGSAAVYANPAEIPVNHVNPLQKSEFLGRDHYTVNPRDAGFRAILPGTPGSPNTYHVRVRSSNLESGDPASNLLDDNLLESGLTSGVYQLQLRLRELDQVAGSSLQFADIRYATNGIEVIGQPIHSHLTGEVAESPLGNETFAGAQQLGNLLNTDRAALGVSGNLGDGGLNGSELDIYQFQVTYDSIQQSGSHVATLLEIDYADALGLPNTNISVYRENADGTIEYVLSAKDSNIADDQPGPLEGVDLDDLSRGSAGVLDPTLGTVELPVGVYYAVVHSDQVMPAELDQFVSEVPLNALLRLEPVNSVVRIAEDHIESVGGSTAAAPEVPVLFGADAPTPWHLGDVTLYVAATGGFGSTDVWVVDPFTGAVEYRLNEELDGSRKDIATDVGDIAMRPSTADFDLGALMAFGHNLEVAPGCNISDENADNYFQISTSEGTLTQLGDNGLETFEFDAENDSDKVSHECDGNDIGDGQHMEALAFTQVNGQLWGFAVGGRPDSFPNRPGVDSHRNNLYSFAPGPNNLGDFAPGEAFHELPERESPNRFVGAGTQIVERGTLDGVTGTITGIAFVGGQMFGVSNQGGLYRITGYTGAGAQASLIATIPSGSGFGAARFEGLAVGPPTVEDGFYSRMLFGIDDRGELYAFSTSGVPQAIFLDGETSVRTGVGADIRGMDFSTLDENLWHVEDFRAGDAGHGVNAAFDGSRAASGGENAFHFGTPLSDTNTNPDDFYDYPGGGHGSIVSNVFSLADYNATDLPTLYFNYFVDTEGQSTEPGSGTLANSDPMLDAFRVFIGGEDGQWEMLATNNSFAATPPDENPDDDELLDLAPFDVQEAFDTASWRQVRVDLSPYASREDDLRLRFDFSTAGSMNTGDEDTVGEELVAVDANQLRDGDSFTVDGFFFGFGGDRFEIELGFTLVVSSGAAIDDGETVTIDGDVFEFIENGARDAGPGNIGVDFNDNESPQTVAAHLEQAIQGNFSPPPQEVDLTVVEPNDTIDDATNTGLTGGPGQFVNAPEPGLIGDNPILITEVGRDVDMLRFDLGTGDRVIVDIDTPDASGLDSVLRLFDENGLELAFSDDDEAPDEDVGTSDSYIDFVAPVAGTYFVGVSGAGNETYDANDASTALNGSTGEYDILITVTAEVTRVNGNRINLPSNSLVVASGPGVEVDGQPGTTGIAVPLNSTMDRQEVAGVIRQVLANFYAGGNIQTIKMFDETVRVIGHSVTRIRSVSGGTELGLTTSLPGDALGAFNSNVRGQNNTHEGVYIDDVVIGLAERGEMVTGQTASTDFAANPLFAATDIVVGDYQLEIRRSAEYGEPDGGELILYRSFDTNDRLAQNFTIEAPFGYEVADGQTFSLSDGVDTLVFEFDDQALPASHPNSGVTQGHVPVPFESNDFEEKADTDVTMAHTIRDAINGADVQAVLEITASLSDGRVTGTSSNAHHVNIYGNVIADMGALNLVQHDDRGDVNREREQGQVLIDSNRISYSSEFGVVVDADDGRDVSALAALAGNLPHAPAGRNLAVPGDAPPSVADRLVPGAVISNNLIYKNAEGGIHFSGDDHLGGDQQPASVPFGRIINNTLVGIGDENLGNQGVGILVSDFASPTILNNVISDFALGLDIDGSSDSTVVGYSLFHQNSQNAVNGEIGAFAIELDSDSPLFVNQTENNYYLADGAQAIDSSLDSLRDRAAMDTIKEPLGIAPSPILAPSLDVLGQKRIDDPAVDTPFGQGANVFKDRGAVDRADFEGPSVFLVNPRDNDALGADTDGRHTYIETAEILNQFAIKFLDGVEPNDPQAGTGVDDGTVDLSKVTLLQEGRRLTAGVDYVFEYDSTSDIIYLNPLAGIWERATNYEIVLSNRDGRIIVAPAGDGVDDGQSFDLVDNGGNSANFEYESGYVLQVPQTLTLSVPLAGASSSGITDGQTFSAGSGGAATTFEFDSNDTTSGTSQVISFAVGDTATDLANSIVTALEESGLGFAPRHLGLGVVHMGSQSFHTANTGDSALTLAGQAAGVADGDLLSIDDFTQVVTFEFDSDEETEEDSGHVPFPFTFDQTHVEISALLVTAMSDAEVSLSPIDLGDGTIHVRGVSLSGGAPLHAVDASQSNLTLSGEPGVRPDLALRIPAVGGAHTTIDDGGVFTVGNATRSVDFEFDSDGVGTPGNVIVQFTAPDPDDDEVIPSTTDEIGESIEAAIAGEFLGISPLYVGGGVVNLNNSLSGVHAVDAGTSGLVKLGEVGVPGAVAIEFTPSEDFSAETMALVIAEGINDTDLLSDVSAFAQDDRVQVYGAGGIDGIGNGYIPQIQDLAGNALKPNRLNGETRFTIFMDSAMDFGDAPASYQTTDGQDGARHEVVPGFSIGELLDTDVDGIPSAAADGDDLDGDNDEDGIQISSPFTVAFDGVIDVTAFGIGDRDGYLDAWIDLNDDGDFGDPLEQILDSHDLANGDNSIVIAMPGGDTVAGDKISRFRFSSAGGLGPVGFAADGEVEDHIITLHANPWHNSSVAMDASGDSFVSPIDVLKIVNFLNFNPNPTNSKLPNPPAQNPPAAGRIDINNDGFASPIDSLMVVSFLNSQGAGEGEAAAGSRVSTSPMSAVFDVSLWDDAGDANALNRSMLTGDEVVQPQMSTSAKRPVEVTFQLPPRGEWLQQLSGRALDLGTVNRLDDALESILDDVAGEVSGDARDEVFAQLRD